MALLHWWCDVRVVCDVWWKLGVFTLLEVLLFSPLAICTAFCAHSGDLGGGECLWVTLRRSSSINRHFFALPFLSSNTLWNFLPLSSHLRRLRLRIFLLPECLPYRRHRELTILRRGRKLICDQDLWFCDSFPVWCFLQKKRLASFRDRCWSRLWDVCFYAR